MDDAVTIENCLKPECFTLVPHQGENRQGVYPSVELVGHGQREHLVQSRIIEHLL